jgi:hypothetical protein
VDWLAQQPGVRQVFYPKLTQPGIYDAYKRPEGGYGGLFSVSLDEGLSPMAFYDALDVYKGPSLGTNYTLACPYTLLVCMRTVVGRIPFPPSTHPTHTQPDILIGALQRVGLRQGLRRLPQPRARLRGARGRGGTYVYMTVCLQCAHAWVRSRVDGLGAHIHALQYYIHTQHLKRAFAAALDAAKQPPPPGVCSTKWFPPGLHSGGQI